MTNGQLKRKNIRLTDFNYGQAGYYFVTICTKDRSCILGSVVGGDAHIAPHNTLSSIGNVVQKYIENAEHGPMWASSPTKRGNRSWRAHTVRPYWCVVSKI